ncbi:hypothetical protein M9H77_12415 [Catharanthus roseus]|uniref:Uncharacterized protein n=1 Tax=Catharanthus roseus TaxID=4058 RepID=A0ACC0BHC6_CATRO|nr:hypothetical protein M9H77_12415 [Catharanthus roseus]
MPKLQATNAANWKRKESRRGKNRAYRLEKQRGHNHIKGHVNSHTQKNYQNYNHHGSFETLVQSTHQFYDGGRHTTPRDRRRGGLGGRGYYRPQEEVPRYEAMHEGNLFDDYGENPNVSQSILVVIMVDSKGDKALDKIKWKVPSFKGKSDPNVFLD